MKTYLSNIVNCLSLNAVVVAFCLFTLMGVSSARAADENRGQLSSSDYKFATDVIRANTEQITLGKLAAQKSTDPAVQHFGQHMVQDHAKA